MSARGALFARAIFTSPTGAFAKYCDEYACVSVVCVCMCVCLSVSEDIFETTQAIFTKFFVHVADGRGSVLLLRHCDTLCTSDFVDDIMFFFHDKPYSDINLATKARFRLNLLIYCNVIQNLISYY